MAKQGEDIRFTIAPERIARAAMELCCDAYGVSIHEMMLASRSRAVSCYARQVAMYLSHVVGKLAISQVAAAFQRDRSTVTHACHVIEDRRDSSLFDGEIEALGNRLREAVLRLYEEALHNHIDGKSARRA